MIKIFFLLGPLTTLLILNCRLIRTIKSSSERQRFYSSQRSNTGDKNATFVLVVIVLVFIVCQTLELVVNVLTVVDRWMNISLDVYKVRLFSLFNFKILSLLNYVSIGFLYT